MQDEVSAGVKLGCLAALCAAAGVGSGCAQQGPPDLLPTPSAHRTVEVAPEADQFGPRADEPAGVVTIAASPEPDIPERRASTKPAWWFDGEREERGERLVCVEALASDLAGARKAVRSAAAGAFADGQPIEIRELTAAPVAHPGGALRYVAYAMVAQMAFSEVGDSAR